MAIQKQPKPDLTGSIVYCRGCMITILYEELMKPPHAGWRFHRGRVYCVTCRNKGLGGKNVVEKNGIWYTEKEFEKLIESRRNNNELTWQ